MSTSNLRIDRDRLLSRIDALARVGAIDGGGVCRLAFSDEDRAGRDRVVAWMRDAGLAISVDRVGNVVGVRQSRGLPADSGSRRMPAAGRDFRRRDPRLFSP